MEQRLSSVGSCDRNSVSQQYEDIIQGEEVYKPRDFVTEFKYSLWSDLCGEQSEFLDAFEQLSYH